MTAFTPEQIRALAEGPSGGYGALSDHLTAVHAALRAAADQLEAVPAQREAFLDSTMLDGMWVAGWHAAIDHVTHVIIADTAPQEDRDE